MQGKYFGFVIGSVVVAWFHLKCGRRFKCGLCRTRKIKRELKVQPRIVNVYSSANTIYQKWELKENGVITHAGARVLAHAHPGFKGGSNW